MDRAERRLVKFQRTCGKSGDELGLADSRLAIGQVEKFRRAFKKSRGLSRQALDYYVQHDLFFAQAVAYSNLGHVDALEYHEAEACTWFKKAVAAYDQAVALKQPGGVPFWSERGDFRAQMLKFMEELKCDGTEPEEKMEEGEPARPDNAG